MSNPYNLYLESRSKAITGQGCSPSTSTPVFSITGNNGIISQIDKCRILSDITASYSAARGAIEVCLDRTTRYHRVFNESSLVKGGRFHAGIHGLPREMRPYIQIDGKPTLEADFNALHLRLLYATVLARELSPFKDAYAIPLPGWGDQESVRKALKYAVLILLNAKSRRKGLKSLQQELNFRKIIAPQGVKATDLESAILTAFPEVQGSLYTGLGLDLQYLESKIAEKVMLAFSRLGKGIVGIHDGFRVKEEDCGDLLVVMEEAYKSETGFSAGVGLRR